MVRSILVLFLLAFAGHLFGQVQDSEGHFLFEPEKFSPPVKDIIASYEGFPATPFMAKNLNGTELYIGDFKGKPLMLLFWSSGNPNCLQHIDHFNRLANQFHDKLSIVSFCDEDRISAKRFAREKNVSFHVIPNSKIFGEAAYANELGYPRAFLIDASGVIRKVIPEEAFNRSQNTFEMIKSIVLNDLK
jgi:peroxiredoxin